MTDSVNKSLDWCLSLGFFAMEATRCLHGPSGSVEWNNWIGKDNYLCMILCRHSFWGLSIFWWSVTLRKDNIFSAILKQMKAQRPTYREAAGAIQSLGLVGMLARGASCIFHVLPLPSVQTLCGGSFCISLSQLETLFPQILFLAWVRLWLARRKIYVRCERQKRGSGYYFLKVFLESCVVTDGQRFPSLCPVSGSSRPQPIDQ